MDRLHWWSGCTLGRFHGWMTARAVNGSSTGVQRPLYQHGAGRIEGQTRTLSSRMYWISADKRNRFRRRGTLATSRRTAALLVVVLGSLRERSHLPKNPRGHRIGAWSGFVTQTEGVFGSKTPSQCEFGAAWRRLEEKRQRVCVDPVVLMVPCTAFVSAAAPRARVRGD